MKKDELIKEIENCEGSVVFLGRVNTGKTKVLVELCKNDTLFVNMEDSIKYLKELIFANEKDSKNTFILNIPNDNNIDFDIVNNFIRNKHIKNLIIDNFNSFYHKSNFDEIINFFNMCKNDKIKVIASSQLPRDNNISSDSIINGINYKILFNKVIIANDKIEL